MSDLIARAAAFARKAHAGQTRKGEAAEPYEVHVAEVAALVTAQGGSEAAIAAAWLHDTVEDCGVSPFEIEEIFGSEVAGYVAELTDDKSLPKPERKRMQVVNASHISPAAALVKLCDKTSNVRALRLSPPSFWDQARRAAYLDWAEEVIASLPPVPAQARAMFDEEVSATRQALGLV